MMSSRLSKNIFLALCAICVLFGSSLSRANTMYEHEHEHEEDHGIDSLSDTAKKPKPIRPLNSYFFDDTLQLRQNFSWSLDIDNNDVILQDIDTALHRFQITYPYMQVGVGSAYLGNLGAASIPLNYLERAQYSNFSFVQAFNNYLKTPDRVQYFNTKKPYTHFTYFTSGSSNNEETSFNAKHMQNVSPSTGVGLEYTSLGTYGIYSGQKARDKNLSLSVAHTGRRYTLHAGYIYNSADLRENGGVVNTGDITDTIYEMPSNIEVALQDAQNKIKTNTFYAVHSYAIPLRRLSDPSFAIADMSTIYIGHCFEYSRYAKRYTDTKDGSADYYDNWYISESTNDSIFESLHTQRLFVQIQPWDRDGVVGLINAGIGYDAHEYYMFNMNSYLDLSGNVREHTSYLYGSIQGKIKRYFDWKANLRYDALGYRNGDMYLRAEASARVFVKDLPITLSAGAESNFKTADYWVQNYFSNHYVWSNSFSKENETRLDVKLSIPQIHFEAGAYQSVAVDKIYYGSDVVPVQHDGNVSLSSLYAMKEFRLGGFRLNHRVLLQWSSNQEVIPVPLASAYVSYNYNFKAVKGVLDMQIGIDGRYNTEYYAFGYNPAIAQFYNQRETQLGDYLTLDAYVTCKWKRMRILAKFQHFNENILGFERNYFTVVNYPENPRMFKLGISWTFYD